MYDKLSEEVEQKIANIRNCTDYKQMAWDWFPPAHADEYYFVSYSHKDYKEVFADIYALQAQGLHVWYDRELRPGKDWEIEARAHIYDFKCKGVIFYISENSVVSESIHKEIEFVKKSGKSYLSINLPVNGEYLSAAEILRRVQPELGKNSEKYRTLEGTFNDKVTYLKLSEEPSARAQRITSLESLPLLKFEVERGVATVIGINDINATVIKEEDFICRDDIGEIVPVKKIGASAFANCGFLEDIELPERLKELGSYAFYNCDSLKSVVIPDGVEEIGENAFNNCDALESITLPDSITKIGDGAFGGCTKLKRVTVPYNAANNTPHKSNDGASPGGRSLLLDVMIEEFKEKVDNIIKDHNYEIVAEHPGTDLLIGNNAFRGCSSLESITIPQGVEGIGNKAFFGCNALKSITIRWCEIQIAADAFDGCISLTSLEADNRLEESWIMYSSQNGILYSKDKTKLVRVPTGAKGVLKIPKCVTQIGDFAFKDCTSLVSITIPDGVTSIGKDAFYNCTSLKRIKVGVENQKYASQDGVLYNKEKTQIVHVPEAIKDATIPDGVTKIGDYAFWDCTLLTSITIPKSVTSIGEDAFKGCTSLEKVNITSIKSWCNIEFGVFDSNEFMVGVLSNPLTYAHNLYLDGELVKNLEIPEDVTSIRKYAFRDCTSLESIIIPNSVTSIGQAAFRGCSSHESVTIGNGVTEIGDYAFRDCDSLKSIIIPDSVTEIGWYAFQGCTSLTSVTIGNSVTSIGYEAFRGCTSLESITIPDSVTSIGSWAFEITAYYNDERNWVNKILYIGNHLIATKKDISGAYEIEPGTKTIADNAFEGRDSLESITIPDSVTMLGREVFKGCTSLKSITIPRSVTFVGDRALAWCVLLKAINYGGTIADWEAIEKSEDWAHLIPDYVIYCTDGKIYKDGKVEKY